MALLTDLIICFTFDKAKNKIKKNKKNLEKINSRKDFMNELKNQVQNTFLIIKIKDYNLEQTKYPILIPDHIHNKQQSLSK